jgi:hypothetical protein
MGAIGEEGRERESGRGREEEGNERGVERKKGLH